VVEALASTNVIAMLIQLTETQNTDIILNCAIAFSKVTSIEKRRGVLAQAKCVDLAPTLTFMMRSGHEDIQINAAVALCNLACEDSLRIEVWKPGTVPDFIVNSLLRVNSNTTKEICARGLFNLLTHNISRTTMIQQGVLYALVKLARLESAEMRLLCVTALYNLSCDKSMMRTLMDMNVVQVITKMCETEFENVKACQLLSGFLNKISSISEHLNKVVEYGALNAIIILSKNADLYTARNCASILCALSFKDEGKDEMCSEVLMGVISRMIASTDSQQCFSALNAICNLSCVIRLHDKIIKSGVIQQVLNVLNIPTNDELCLCTAQILCNLVYDTNNSSALLEMGVVQALKSMLSTAAFNAHLAYSLMSQFSLHEPSLAQLNKFGAARVLAICGSDADSATNQMCLAAACRLSRQPECQSTIIQEGILNLVEAMVGA
jgi:hypothetical protein